MIWHIGKREILAHSRKHYLNKYCSISRCNHDIREKDNVLIKKSIKILILRFCLITNIGKLIIRELSTGTWEASLMGSYLLTPSRNDRKFFWNTQCVTLSKTMQYDASFWQHSVPWWKQWKAFLASWRLSPVWAFLSQTAGLSGSAQQQRAGGQSVQLAGCSACSVMMKCLTYQAVLCPQ